MSRPTLLVAPTREFGKVASALHGIKLQGQVDVMNGISAAQVNCAVLAVSVDMELNDASPPV